MYKMQFHSLIIYIIKQFITVICSLIDFNMIYIADYCKAGMLSYSQIIDNEINEYLSKNNIWKKI